MRTPPYVMGPSESVVYYVSTVILILDSQYDIPGMNVNESSFR
jgi:hypothetical protein